MPYRLRTISRLNLPADQKLLWKLDLHFSHMTPEFRAFAAANHILLLYVPARCTDSLQEADVAVNAPYKVACKASFRDQMHLHFDEYLDKAARATLPPEYPEDSTDEQKISLLKKKRDEARMEAAKIYSPKMTAASLKPVLIQAVKAGLIALSTDQMKETIRLCFLQSGLFQEMLKPERYAAAVVRREELLAANVEDVLVAEPDDVPDALVEDEIDDHALADEEP